MSQHSQLIIGSESDAISIASTGSHDRPHVDCNGDHVVAFLMELGCRPEIVHNGSFSDGHSVLLCRVPRIQLQHLAQLSAKDIAKFESLSRRSTKRIALPRDDERYAGLYRRAIQAAQTALGSGQSLYARIESIGPRGTQ